MGKCLLQAKEFDMAKNYFLKFLVMSWYLNNKYQEVIAYDYLGVIYYYQGNLKTSEILHNRMSIGKTEGDQSALKSYKVMQYEKEIELTED